MSRDAKRLERPPSIAVEVLGDRTGDEAPSGFLRLRRLTLRNRYADGNCSRPYDYDLVERRAMDAVGIVLYVDDDQGPRVCLRSALRPPLAFRPQYELPLDPSGEAVVWEIPAGLVEPHERGEAGLRQCAARETQEEVGLPISAESFSLLGDGTYLSPGVMGEKIYFLSAPVPQLTGAMEDTSWSPPAGDGSPVEERATVRFVPLSEALRAAREGEIADLKTELALRRLAEWRGVS